MSNLLGRVQKQREEAAEKSLATFKSNLAQIISDQRKEVNRAEDLLANVRAETAKQLEDVESALEKLQAHKANILHNLDAEIAESETQLAQSKLARRGLFGGLLSCIPVVGLICFGLVLTIDQQAQAAAEQKFVSAEMTLERMEQSIEAKNREVFSKQIELQGLEKAADILINQTGGWTSGTRDDGTVWLLPPEGHSIERKRARHESDPGFERFKFYWFLREL